MTRYIYLHQSQKAVSYTQLPSFLFEAPSYKALSNEVKLLYAFILRRADLFRKNGWADEYGRIYLYYPINDVYAIKGNSPDRDEISDKNEEKPCKMEPFAHDSRLPESRLM